MFVCVCYVDMCVFVCKYVIVFNLCTLNVFGCVRVIVHYVCLYECEFVCYIMCLCESLHVFFFFFFFFGGGGGVQDE